MKKAVIICLLSLSLCLSQAASADVNASAKINDTKGDGKEVKQQIDIVTLKTDPSPKKQTEATTAAHTEPKVDKPEAKATADDKPAENKPDVNKTDKSPETSPKTNEANKTSAETTTKVTDKAETKPEPTDAKKATTQPPVTVKPTEDSKAVTEKPLLAARGFDGMSFVGGIVLTLGLLAIGFMGFKYYKNQTERNYHTL